MNEKDSLEFERLIKKCNIEITDNECIYTGRKEYRGKLKGYVYVLKSYGYTTFSLGACRIGGQNIEIRAYPFNSPNVFKFMSKWDAKRCRKLLLENNFIKDYGWRLVITEQQQNAKDVFELLKEADI